MTNMNDHQTAVIASKDLAAGYQGDVVWKGANIAIEKGEFVAIIGPNGSGKTTLLRLLLGLQKPLHGDLTVFGEPPKRGNARIGYVPQRHQIDHDMRIECLELVRLGFSGKRWGMSFSHEDREAGLEALKAVGGQDLAHRPLGVLSGGELQRILLAEALVSNPELLLLDEPLANLDIRRERELVDLISEVVRARNVTALLIAHNINPLLLFLDKVIYIANGKVAIGKPEEVLTSASLSSLYGTTVEVLRDSCGHIEVIGVERDLHRCEPGGR
ncbi:MAG TPA: ATP-binding cassette domain-containing protein [Methanomassiliicoccales archaeon]|nr:ATP-binding cassette domain-containing protein [Methanomassiliicoccales archaeon]